MPRVVSFSAPRTAEVVDEPAKPLTSHDVRIRTLLSGISAGTELTAYRGSNPYLSKRWNEELRLFVDGVPSASSRWLVGATRRSARSSSSAAMLRMSRSETTSGVRGATGAKP